ncbi:Predicted metal-dependent hydrolase, TIM-barrel fold [Pseudosulfitobacter pseudonitzschiae]|uniref:2-pyrone-4,6-dicarboxylate hydrolase n=1 Tax=Pseudosulfitobacter pseudonitzschiae TaxID=1402135 RepID=A0A073J2T0_9RHOB|nr:amidohydrolase family protein [Pseudosulfitobacter pseudonitzschiae]KEJ95991.1 2-pyrone-4,6-dicarboxylate hydrolase [Pseudosulfitobacter pseudonitzschiae]QKS09849.1 amidohydrolase family protein [Pseudosulfitobacter pseudonitzschiae]SHE93376.1 Predicted metal-dependent hydrolase, TIM-barrel fold [Pseudosulfitobacter pseudonitzschiae]
MIEFDCHAHVYETVTPVDGARYVPGSPAPLADWLALQAAQGLRGGVIVQVSFLGADNSQMCDALSQLDSSRFAGVGVVPIDVDDAELDRLVRSGMRGVRWNLVRGAAVPDLNTGPVQRFLGKLRDRGLHLEVHLEGPRLAPLLSGLTDQGIDLVIDHFGLPSEPQPRTDPMIRAVRGLSDRSALFFKFAAHYRVPFDVQPHAQELMTLLDDNHVVWGSDWPHTQHETCASYDNVHALSTHWAKMSDREAVKRLYGLTG